MTKQVLQQIRLVPCGDTTLAFDDAAFRVLREGPAVRVARPEGASVLLRPRMQPVPYEAEVIEGFIPAASELGTLDHERYFLVDWDEAGGLPTVTFTRAPLEVQRRLEAGEALELGLENVARYRVVYADGVEASFERTAPDAYRFAFSTGLTGSFWRDTDGSYTIRFRGQTLPGGEEQRRAQSKFIVSRCKYSGNLLLILQEAATVYLE